MSQAGYSGTPLVKKLGFKEHGTFCVVHEPEDYASWIGTLPGGCRRIDLNDTAERHGYRSDPYIRIQPRSVDR